MQPVTVKADTNGDGEKPDLGSVANSVEHDQHDVQEKDMKSSLLSYDQIKKDKKNVRLSHVLSPVVVEKTAKSRKASFQMSYKTKSLVLPPLMPDQEMKKDIMRAEAHGNMRRESGETSKKSGGRTKLERVQTVQFKSSVPSLNATQLGYVAKNTMLSPTEQVRKSKKRDSFMQDGMLRDPRFFLEQIKRNIKM